MQRTPLTLTAIVLISACERPDGSLEDQLEALTLRFPDSDGAAVDHFSESVVVSGALSVDASASDPSLTFATANGSFSADLHLPGASDLRWLDGAVVEAQLPPSEDLTRWGTPALALMDAEGPAFVAQLVGHAPDAADSFLGAGFARFGPESGYDERGTYGFQTRSAIVQTDDGPLEVLPGEVHAISRDGVSWRFVLIAAYKVESQRGAFGPTSKCMGPPDALSFEMVRIGVDDDAETQLLRPDGLAPAVGQGCGI